MAQAGERIQVVRSRWNHGHVRNFLAFAWIGWQGLLTLIGRLTERALNIKNRGDLQELETRIGMALGRFDLPQVLMGLEKLHDEFEPFVIAGMTLFALRYATPRIARSQEIEQLTKDQIALTFEPFYIINSVPFRENINKALSARAISPGQWSVLAVDELEKLQPHVAAGFKMVGILEKLQTQTFGETLEEAHTSTGRVYKDSFLYDMDVEIYKRLKIPI